MVTFQTFLSLSKQIAYICSGLKASCSSFWHNLEAFIVRLSLLFKWVIKWAVKFLTVNAIFTWACFIEVRMKLQLLPTMCFFALSACRAALVIVGYISLRVPLIALNCIVEIKMPLPAKILPVMGVNTWWSVVLGLIKWAPNCFVVEKIEVHIHFVVMQQIDSDIVLVMCKCTVVSVFAAIDWVELRATWASCAEFSFIFIWMVELFNTVMCIWAVITVWAILICCYKLADLSCVAVGQTTTIFVFVVVVDTAFRVMSFGRRTRKCFIAF